MVSPGFPESFGTTLLVVCLFQESLCLLPSCLVLSFIVTVTELSVTELKALVSKKEMSQSLGVSVSLESCNAANVAGSGANECDECILKQRGQDLLAWGQAQP